MENDLRKRYWVFEILKYYPGGGLNDIIKTTDDRPATIAMIMNDEPISYTEVFDTDISVRDFIEG